MALSADGNTALVSGPFYHTELPSGQIAFGAAWVFVRSADGWVQQGPTLLGNDMASPAYFGRSVALSADGNTALVGGSGDSDSVGAAWVFTRTGSTWTQEGPKLVASDGAASASFLGGEVALSADGTTAIINGRAEDGGTGAAWIFKRSGTSWVQQGGRLTGAGIAPDQRSHFGQSLALSEGGEIALVGGGGGWLFARSGSTWTQQGPKLWPDGANIVTVGKGAALSGDGSVVVLGAEQWDGFGTGTSGAAWTFVRSGSSWLQRGNRILGSNATGPTDPRMAFGARIALSADGGTALFGAARDRSGLGSAWVFVNSLAIGNLGSSVTHSPGSPAVTLDADLTVSNLRGTTLASATVAISSGLDSSDVLWANTANTGIAATYAAGTLTLNGTDTLANYQAVLRSITFDTSLAAATGTRTIDWTISHGSVTSPTAKSTVRHAAAPGPPTGVVASAGDGVATVSFGPPISDGGMPISSFTATAHPGGATVTGPASPIAFTGLANGTSYTFTVRATNALGTGAASAPSNAVVPLPPIPGIPTGVSASAGVGQATVTFAAGGGSPATSYTVTAAPGGATMTGSASPITFTGLTYGVSYTFVVTATNAGGTSPASTASNTIRTLPGPADAHRPLPPNTATPGILPAPLPQTPPVTAPRPSVPRPA